MLIPADTEKSREKVRHLYLGEAVVLRPDLTPPQNSWQEKRGDNTKQ
ncbi:hypothetical protein DXX99_09600 [Ammonifex thiophilus]|uniref:chorismate mutase n=1 Tax=Ammonifex thiophilus TaxID=444093 RepID=A0A3D8P3M3_9THEO|nr:hypothetical protein DXX99_09600 [Ammonifex thiophilus]